MAIHYKFKSSRDYDTLAIDGAFLSLSDLKRTIVEQKRLGTNADFDLKITNAQTGEGLTD